VRKEAFDPKHVIPDSIMYIISGNATVWNEQEGGVMGRLSKGAVFGESHLTRKVTWSTVGEIRAGILPVTVIKFSYKNLDRLLTFPELACVRDMRVDPIM
jgi:CRP-like cAMP-binding protein